MVFYVVDHMTGYSSILGNNYSNMFTNGQNHLVTEVITFIFLFILEDIVNAQCCTSKPHDNTFTGWHCERYEATVKETLGIEDTKGHKVDAMFDAGLVVHWDTYSGYLGQTL